MDVYCAVIADVVQSRALPDRSDFQREFLAFVEGIDKLIPAGEVVSRFVVTAGDELQGLLRTPAPAYDLLTALEEALGIGRFRMGVGMGGLTTDLKPTCLGMDGPAFHRARAALEESKEKRRTLTYNLGHGALDRLVTSLAAVLERLRFSWTGRQRQMIRLLAAHPDQASVAATLGVSRAAVNKVLKTASWRVYDQARQDLAGYLATCVASGHAGPGRADAESKAPEVPS